MRILAIIIFFLLCSCTSVKLDKEKIADEFGSNFFTLYKPMYLTFYFNCAPFIGAYEDKTADIDFVEMIDSEDIDYFEPYKNIDVGDKNCSPSKDIRVYNFLNEGTVLEVTSIKDVLNASWWFLEIKGYVVIKGKKRFFRMELPYGKDENVRDTLARVFDIKT